MCSLPSHKPTWEGNTYHWLSLIIILLELCLFWRQIHFSCSCCVSLFFLSLRKAEKDERKETWWGWGCCFYFSSILSFCDSFLFPQSLVLTKQEIITGMYLIHMCVSCLSFFLETKSEGQDECSERKKMMEFGREMSDKSSFQETDKGTRERSIVHQEIRKSHLAAENKL